jgi:hypothetical protein
LPVSPGKSSFRQEERQPVISSFVASSSKMTIEDADVHNSRSDKLPCGIKVVALFFLFHLLLVVIPAWSYFHYDFVATQLHLEEPRELADEAVVQTNRAIGLVNCIWVIPLNLFAIVGLTCCSRRQNTSDNHRRTINNSTPPPPWVFTVSYTLLGVSVYWPLQYISSRCTYSSARIDHVPLRGSDLGMLTIVLVLSLWSSYYLTNLQQETAGMGSNCMPTGKEKQPQSYSSTLGGSNEIEPLFAVRQTGRRDY